MTFATITFAADTGAEWDSVRSVLDGWCVSVTLPDGSKAVGVVDAQASTVQSRRAGTDSIVLRHPDTDAPATVPLVDGVHIQYL